MTVRVQREDFDTAAELERLGTAGSHIGAIVSFTGLVRDFSESPDPAPRMVLEHYPGMTERQLEAIVAEAERRWPLDGCLVIHRYGELAPGDRIVLVVTASAHRKAAFEAAEFLVDWLKTKAPFWKLEQAGDTRRWVEAKTSDDQAADRWRR